MVFAFARGRSIKCWMILQLVSLPQSLPNTHPQQDLRKCNVRQVVNLSSAEIDTIRMRYGIIVQNLLLQQFPAFESFKPSSPLTTYCQYAENMSEKSETVTMPVLLKDEKKYAECVAVGTVVAVGSVGTMSM